MYTWHFQSTTGYTAAFDLHRAFEMLAEQLFPVSQMRKSGRGRERARGAKAVGNGKSRLEPTPTTKPLCSSNTGSKFLLSKTEHNFFH